MVLHASELTITQTAMRLDSLLEETQRGVLAPDTAEWLRHSLTEWISGEASTLDAALLGGTAEVGERPRQLIRLNIRDRHLKKAAGLCEGRGPAQKASALVREIERFETVTWRRWKCLEYPPENAGLLKGHLFQARKINGNPLPGYRQIIRILTSSPNLASQDIG